jgi:hypothetical protein
MVMAITTLDHRTSQHGVARYFFYLDYMEASTFVRSTSVKALVAATRFVQGTSAGKQRLGIWFRVGGQRTPVLRK